MKIVTAVTKFSLAIVKHISVNITTHVRKQRFVCGDSLIQIISGSLSGRRIDVPPSRKIRPTSNLAREGIFNSLASYLDFKGISILDLYAGSGAFGLESASRGAESVTFVDNNSIAAKTIVKNILRLGVFNSTVYRTSVNKLITNHISNSVDLVFVDPPYYFNDALVNINLAILSESKWIKSGTLIILERCKLSKFLRWSSNWNLLNNLHYGSTYIKIFEVMKISVTSSISFEYVL